MRRLYAIGLVLAATLPGVGCSTIGAPFGLTPPAHKLTADAERIRTTSGVAASARELNKALHPAFVIEPGDTLLVLPTRLDSPVRLPGDQPVLADGTIDLGEYGRPVAAGKTVEQVEAEVKALVAARVKDKDDAAVTVRLIGRVSKVFYVLGEVNAPGSFPLAGRETVLDGIIAAGGLTRQAATRKIILSRPTQPEGCRVVHTICYDNIVQLGDTTTNYQLQAGDRIFVASKGTLDDLPFGRKATPPCCGPQVGCPPGGACPPAGSPVPGP